MKTIYIHLPFYMYIYVYNIIKDSERFYYGVACECDNFSCLKDSVGTVCGSELKTNMYDYISVFLITSHVSDHGSCECGVCTCDQYYTGELCDCYTEVDTCTDSNSVSYNAPRLNYIAEILKPLNIFQATYISESMVECTCYI